MNKLEKNLKLSCLACLFTGLAVLIVGIIAGATANFDADAVCTIFCGLGATPTGVQAARLANVPSNAGRVRWMALVMLIADLVFVGVSLWRGDPTVAQLAVMGLAALVALAMLVFAQREVKALEKV